MSKLLKVRCKEIYALLNVLGAQLINLQQCCVSVLQSLKTSSRNEMAKFPFASFFSWLIIIKRFFSSSPYMKFKEGREPNEQKKNYSLCEN